MFNAVSTSYICILNFTSPVMLSNPNSLPTIHRNGYETPDRLTTIARNSIETLRANKTNVKSQLHPKSRDMFSFFKHILVLC
jgi:hypothetical protein